MTTCGCCDTPTTGTTLCPNHTKALAYALLAIADFHEELETIKTKQTRFNNTTKTPTSKTTPAPIDLRFTSPHETGTRLEDDTRSTITTWTQTLTTEQPPLHGTPCPHPCLHTSCNTIRTRRPPTNTIRSMCLYLDRNHRHIESAHWAPTMLDELLYLEGQLRRYINPPEQRWPAGYCQCGADLMMRTNTTHTQCPNCGTQHSAHERRQYLLTEAEHVLVTATEAAGALASWTDYDGSVEKLTNRIRMWGERGRITIRGDTTINGRQRPLYRLGDIRQLLETDATRKAQTTNRRQRKTPT